MNTTALRLMPVALAATLAAGPALAQSKGEVNLYSYREQKLIQPLLDAFTKETGIKVNVVTASRGLDQRMKSEGAQSPADVLMTVDIGRLQDAVEAGVTQSIKSATLEKVIPPQYHGADGQWYGIAARARVVYASKDRVKQDKITYEELADPKWKGKICIRSGQHMYNNALFAHVIAKHGEKKAEEWLRGLKANLAQRPSGGDRETARDIAAGTCDIGIANTYYWALMNDRVAKQKPWADATRVILPTFEGEGGGTHVNITGVVLAKHAPNKDNAMKFIEWMVTPQAQEMYANSTFEYPLREGVEISKTIASFGPLKPDSITLAEVAKHKKAAATLVDKVGFDQ